MPYSDAIQPVVKATKAMEKYPKDSLSPIAKPRCFSPTKSIFITTVLDQVNPWFIPSSTLANIIQFQFWL